MVGFSQLSDKITAANAAIDRVLLNYRKPAFMCSFGKDSMVLLHILASRNIRLPVIFHRDPWWPNKYAFADSVIQEMGLEVHDYPPFAVTMWEGKSIMAFTNHYQTGNQAGAVLQMPKNIVAPEQGRKYLCGLKDVMERPTGGYDYPWDCVLIGHKSSDQDQIAGNVTLNCDIKQNGGVGPDAAFPLRQWTDTDIWDYTDKHNVPQQSDRYNLAERREYDDKMPNSDYAHVCIACIDRRNKALSVHCPKLGCEVSTVADLVAYDSPKHAYYGEHNAC